MIWRASCLSPLFFLLLVGAAAGQHRFTVSPVTPSSKELPSPRTQHCTVEVNTQDGYFLIVHGGRDGNRSLSDTWTYGVKSNEWQPLLPREASLPNDPPPAMYGSIGGYRFVPGFDAAFLYVTLGTEDGATRFHNGMWAMELQNFTWRRVRLDGDLPSPRFAAAGGLERFAKRDDSVRAELIVTHGFGPRGPLSDAFQCEFSATDPYRATWRRIRAPAGLHALRAPHPAYLAGSSFTPKRDLVLFGGCYSARTAGGYCPSAAAWELAEATEPAAATVAAASDDAYHYAWRSLPSGPPARVAPAMAQALAAFKGAYERWEEMVVVFSGTLRTGRLHARQVLSVDAVSHEEIALYSRHTESWFREHVIYDGPGKDKANVMMARQGASLSLVRGDRASKGKQHASKEFYLLFGGELDDGQYSNDLLLISFDPFVPPRTFPLAAKFWTRLHVHGLLMFLGVAIFMLTGSFVARYGREKRNTSYVLFAHVALQCAGLALLWAGLGVADLARNGYRGAFAHAYLGYVVVFLASLQPLYAVVALALRWQAVRKKFLSGNASPRFTSPPKKKFVTWKVLHAASGAITVILGLVNITLGIFMLTTPLLLWVHWLVFCVVVATVALWMELTAAGAPRDENYDMMEPDAFAPGSAFLSSLSPSASVTQQASRKCSFHDQRLPGNRAGTMSSHRIEPSRSDRFSEISVAPFE